MEISIAVVAAGGGCGASDSGGMLDCCRGQPEKI